MRLYILTPLLLAGLASAGLFGGDSSTAEAASSTSTASASSSSDTTSSEVAFLQTLQYAQVASMSCLITLVNLTTTPLGTCLGLTDLADLVSNPDQNSSFSDQLNTYLGTVCQQTCSDSDLQEGKAMLDDNNGTSDLCLPATLNGSTTANSNTFFDALVAGNSTTLEGYQDSVFTQAECTGCMYEMFKAAQYTMSSIRGQTVTDAFGNHLKNDCPSSSSSDSTTASTNGTADTSTIDWSDVDDQQIPDALQVSQSTASSTSGAGRVVDSWVGGVLMGLVAGALGWCDML
ncbi:hypothetical protein B9479_006477 [Cryptococcus floricola]|uniref:Uncharacterized protein n=1 Tax=Cryptococcus floricola TaxID=2591691 RepID=A0A5D3ARL7_9TREE|nr:hypothetical protein B9479_006477 [Cryptococcus floricola]